MEYGARVVEDNDEPVAPRPRRRGRAKKTADAAGVVLFILSSMKQTLIARNIMPVVLQDSSRILRQFARNLWIVEQLRWNQPSSFIELCSLIAFLECAPLVKLFIIENLG